jgi:hypothetical protein
MKLALMRNYLLDLESRCHMTLEQSSSSLSKLSLQSKRKLTYRSILYPPPHNPLGLQWTPVDSSGFHWTSLYTGLILDYQSYSTQNWTPLDWTGLSDILNTKLDYTGLDWTANCI